MKMKIFEGGDSAALETKINEWLKNERMSKIHYITHANNAATMLITVWWM